MYWIYEGIPPHRISWCFFPHLAGSWYRCQILPASHRMQTWGLHIANFWKAPWRIQCRYRPSNQIHFWSLISFWFLKSWNYLRHLESTDRCLWKRKNWPKVFYAFSKLSLVRRFGRRGFNSASGCHGFKADAKVHTGLSEKWFQELSISDQYNFIQHDDHK